MQSTVPTEMADRIFEIEINGNAVPCAEAHILCALPEGIHGEIPAFYARLCEEFILYAKKTLAPEFAERFASTETLRERCALKIPVLTVKIRAESEETLTVITKYTLAYSARDVKRNEIRTEWDAQRGIMVKKRANKKGST